MSFFSELKRRNVLKVGVAYSAACWLLFQILDLVLTKTNAPDWVMQAYLTAVAIGLPIAVTCAWFFELTPVGIRLAKHVERSQSINRHTGHQLNRGIVMILSMAVVLFFTDRFRDEIFTKPGEETGKNQEISEPSNETPVVDPVHSIAVLPFRVTGTSPGQAGFGHAIALELLNTLVKNEALEVAPGALVFSLEGKDLEIPAISARPGVDYVLEGDVHLTGQQMQITIHLIDVSQDLVLLSETYPGSVDETGKIQKEIIHEVSTILNLKPAPAG